MKKFVTVVGGSVVDLIFEIPKNYLLRHNHSQSISLPYGSKMASSSYTITVGGSGANVAAGLSKLGYETVLRTILASDALTEFIKTDLSSKAVKIIDNQSAKATAVSVVLRLLGDRSIITGSYPNDSWPLADLPDNGWIHLGPLPERSDSLLQRVTEHRLKTGQGMSMNPSMAQIEERSRVFTASLKLLDVIFLNLQEALRLTRLPQGTDIAQVFRSLHALGVRVVCVTDGERGAWVSNQSHIWQAESVCDRICRVDATGAGDGFASGFLAGYIASDKEADDEVCQQSLEMAMLNSGSVVEGVGAQETLLTSKEIEQDLGKVKIKLIR